MRVLDLFAGTGALGLEALSRGATEAVFVETGRPALALLRQNLARLAPGAQVMAVDATRLGPCPSAPFDLVFLDPPYDRGLGERALAAALAGGWLAPGRSSSGKNARPSRRRRALRSMTPGAMARR